MSSTRAHIAARYAAAMECCWIATALLSADALLPHPHGLLLAVPVVLMYPAGAAAAMLLQRVISKDWLQWAAWLALLIGVWVYMAVGPLPGGDGAAIEGTDYRRFFTGMAAGAAWLRGWLLPGREPDPADVSQGFMVGVFGLVPAMLLKEAGAQFIMLTMAFVAFALIAHRQAKAADQQEVEAESGKGMSAIVVALIGVMVAGMLISLLVSPSWVAWLTEMPRWIVDHLASFFGVDTTDATDVDDDSSSGGSNRRKDQGLIDWPQLAWVKWIFDIFEGKETILGVLVMILATGIVCFAVWVMWKRHQNFARLNTEGLRFERSGMNLSAILLQIARWLWWELRYAARAFVQLLAGLRHWLPARHSGSVRGIYLLALRYLAQRGWPRAAHESPEEYGRRLLAAWRPEGGRNAEQAFATLTTAFVADCYGPHRIEAHARGLDWRHLRKDLNVVKPPRKQKAEKEDNTKQDNNGREA